MNISSIKSRVSSIRKFCIFLQEKELTLEEVDFFVIEDFFENEKHKETSFSTISNYYSYLKAFFNFCKQNRFNTKVDYSQVNREKVIKENIEVFNDEEIKEIFKVVNTISRDEVIKARDQLIFQFLFYTGITLGELHSLKVFQSHMSSNTEEADYFILLDQKVVFFRQPFERELPLSETIVNRIEYYRELLCRKSKVEKIPDGSYLFLSTYGKRNKGYSQISYTTIQNRMAKIKENSSFNNKKLSIKNIRHSFIKKIIDDGNRLDVISQIVGLDVASLKYYLTTDDYYDNKIKELISKNHPFHKYF
jgi:site-specific recombinase XerD